MTYMHRDTPTFDFSGMPDLLVFLIQIDGMAFDPFREMLEQGDLPAIKSLLKDLPATYGPAISTFPSSTAPSLPEMFTSRWCDNFYRHPRKINAFDRVQKRALKYEFIPEAWEGELTDIFDIFRQKGDKILSFFSGEFNAAAITYHDSIAYSIDALGKISGLETESYDRRVVDRLIQILEGGAPYPRLSFVGIGGLDLIGHWKGPGSDDYRKGLRDTDAIVEKLLEFLRNAKDEKGTRLFDRSLFVLFGDHGMTQSDKHIDIAGLLKAKGLKVSDLGSISHIVAEKVNPFWMLDRELLSVPGGSSISELYVRRKRGEQLLEWDEFCPYSVLRDYPLRPSFEDRRNIDIVEVLKEIDGMGEIMVNVCEDVVQVVTPQNGSATIFRRRNPDGDTFSYRPDAPDSSSDPFGYLTDPMAVELVCASPGMTIDNWTESTFDSDFHTTRQWVEATARSGYPAAPALIPKAFTKHRTSCEIIVNAAPNFNFSKYFSGDHGPLTRENITTGILLAGPGVMNGADMTNYLLIDTLPTLLKLLKIKAPPSFEHFLDGVAQTGIIE